jgi:hypothetical protein
VRCWFKQRWQLHCPLLVDVSPSVCVFVLLMTGPAADATDALQPWGFLCNPDEDEEDCYFFCPFPSNGGQVEWYWQVKTEVLGEKPVPVSLCPPQIPHGLNRDRTRASEVGGRRLTAWAMARPKCVCITLLIPPLSADNRLASIFHAESVTYSWWEGRGGGGGKGFEARISCNKHLKAESLKHNIHWRSKLQPRNG